MLNGIWLGMIVAGFAVSVLKGNTEAFSGAAVQGADKAIRLLISMAGTMCLWSGMMKIAEASGLSRALARLLSPMLHRLLPDYREKPLVMQAVSANVSANLLGLGNAATPLGILAMKEMQKTNPLRTEPNNSMVMFVVLNTASIQLIPSTIAALRQSAGSMRPYEIMPYVWIASLGALAVGIGWTKLLSAGSCHWRKRPKNRG